MHRSEINEDVKVEDCAFDLDGDYGYRPILLTAIASVDGSDVAVPVDQDSPEGMILALTEEQGMQALLLLARQLGKDKSLEAITKDEEG
jgi:hypothetical protein